MRAAAPYGSCFEDLEVGQVIRHPLGRTITQADDTWFTLLTMTTDELHFNADYAGRSEHGRELVNSTLSLAIVVGLSVSGISQNAFANLGWDDVRLTAPVFDGNTFYAESVITRRRESASRPESGILTCFTRGLNQHGVEVMSFRRTVLVLKRTLAGKASRFPTNPTAISARAGREN
ncbi:MAG TPA: MaoC family dehydratase [Pseudonocardia sp.]|nr:MaoC family dehydratase [Pseudonocardia sp.]